MKAQFVFVFFLIFFFQNTFFFGQYTEVINSNRPGFSEAPYSLGTGVYQVESSLFYRKTENNSIFSRPRNIGLNMLVRAGLFSEKLEINVNFTAQQDQIVFNNIFQSTEESILISQFNIAGKYLIYQPKYKDKSKEVRSWKKRYSFDYKRLIPSVGIYAGANTNIVDRFYQVGKIAPIVGVLLQQNFTNTFNLINNFYYNNIGTKKETYTYIVTATKSFRNRFSSFIEYKGDFFQTTYNHNVGAGLAYLFNRNLQINGSGRFLIEGETEGFFTSIGLSFRIDNHKDSYIDLDRIDFEKNKTTIDREKSNRDNFFKRIFKKIFKKK